MNLVAQTGRRVAGELPRVGADEGRRNQITEQRARPDRRWEDRFLHGWNARVPHLHELQTKPLHGHFFARVNVAGFSRRNGRARIPRATRYRQATTRGRDARDRRA